MTTQKKVKQSNQKNRKGKKNAIKPHKNHKFYKDQQTNKKSKSTKTMADPNEQYDEGYDGSEGEEFESTIQEMEVLLEETFPAEYQKLEANGKTIADIASYCDGAYPTTPDPKKEKEEFDKTRKYVTDALLNVAYYIQSVSSLVSNFVALQDEELGRIQSDIQAINEHMRSSYEQKGSNVFRPQESVRAYTPRDKVKKLEGDDLPPTAQPIEKFTRNEDV